jgi:hypothetical protein
MKLTTFASRPAPTLYEVLGLAVALWLGSLVQGFLGEGLTSAAGSGRLLLIVAYLLSSFLLLCTTLGLAATVLLLVVHRKFGEPLLAPIAPEPAEPVIPDAQMPLPEDPEIWQPEVDDFRVDPHGE